MQQRKDCVRCELLESLDQQDTDALITEQLSLEVGNLVSDELRDQRLIQCQSCPFFQKGLCLKCGCYTRFRASLRNKSCPDGRW
ncbi:DUF6171 family protein [Lapidilactobacillus luobeiensis]|uniref:DUF6171 family protein n=1 Tax=Lapidilactobacillus luobeiensis TaxID=2950371 RepID=UPI0035A21E7B